MEVLKNFDQNIKTPLKGKLPAQAIELEEAVIGAIMVDKYAIDEVMQIINRPEVFYKEAHQLIFQAYTFMFNNSIPIDLLTTSDTLKKQGNLETVGGDFYLINLTQKISSAANIEHHARIVLQQWVKRRFSYNAGKLIDLAYDETADIFNMIEINEKQLDEITDVISLGKTAVTFTDALDHVVKRVEVISNLEPGAVSGISTGFNTVDRFTGGWQNTDLIVIAARPGMGKTALILKNLLEVALKGQAVGMFSLEMSIQQLTTRLVAINSYFHLAQLFRDGFKDEKAEQYFINLLSVTSSMQGLPIYIDDNPSITIAELYLKARQWKRQHDIKILFVDYIQLMAGSDKSTGNREQEISTISRKLKHLAKELKIPVVALSQLSRSVETRGGSKRPRLADLRESGAIEQDADIVAFIYRPEYYGIELEPEHTEYNANSELIFSKYRQGSLSTVYLYFDANKTKFMDPEDNTGNTSPF